MFATGPPRMRWRRWCVATAMALVAAVALVTLPPGVAALRRALLVRQLAAALDSSPFPAPARFVAHRQKPASKDKVVRASAVVLNASAAAGPEQDHAAGLAHLSGGDPRKALEHLRAAAAAAPDNAQVWSDLAGAELVHGSRSNEPDAFFRALAAADEAVRLDPRLVEARFNRASAADALGVRELADDLWNEYLDADADSAWRIVAHRRQRAARWPANELTEWLEAKTLLDDEAGHSDRVDALVRSYPEHARRWAEGEFLSKWADAVAKGDFAAAEKHLNDARRIAECLQRLSGESLLAESVAAIDRASSRRDIHARRALVRGYLAYREGRQLFSDQSYTRAAERLEAARQHFSEAGSPMATVSEFFLASAAYGRNEPADALDPLRMIVAKERRHPGHKASLAYALWSISVCEAALGRWADSLASAQEALAIFVQLGERSHAAAMHAIIAEDFEFLGEPLRAREHSIMAMRLSSRAGDRYRLLVAIGAASRGEIRRQRWPVARSLAELELRLAGRAGPPHLVTHSLGRLAVAEYRLGHFERAQTAIARAAIVAARVTDPAARAKLVGDVAALHGAMLRDRDPRGAVALLTRSIEFHEHSSRTFALPELYLERARGHLAAGDERSALLDLDRGIGVLEAQRALVRDVNLRTGMLDDSRGLFTDAVALLLRRRDVARAFAYAERGRARALLDEIGGVQKDAYAPDDVVRRLSRELEGDTVLLEYVTLPDRLVVFIAAGGTIETVDVQITRGRLDAAVHSLLHAIRSDRSAAEIRARSAVLDRLLIEPVRGRIRGAKRLVVVAEGALQRLPFACLFDSATRTYLVEHVALIKAPSASVFLGTMERYRRRMGPEPLSAGVFANPQWNRAAHPGLRPLPMAELEGAEIERNYARRLLVTGRAATRKRFAAVAPEHDVVHYGGHAVVNAADSRRSALIFSPDDVDADGAFDAAEIATCEFSRTRLIMLAACSTSVGPTETAEGVTSIARAFLVAGVPSVIGTLWDVEDTPTRQISVAVHRSLSRGMSPADALRLAQLAALRSGSEHSRHPKTWGAFELHGAGGD